MPYPFARWLAAAAGVLGIAAAFAGSPYAANRGRIDVAALARSVAQEDDHVTAIELAGWIRERRANVRIVDVRSKTDYDSFHIPTAEHISIDSLPMALFRRNETIVLYSEGGAHAAQAWVFLRALGYEKVFFLRGGLYEWLDQVMNPAIAPGASPSDSARFAPIAALSRYFGGTPHVGVPSALDDVLTVPARKSETSDRGPGAKSTSSMVARIRRRGC